MEVCAALPDIIGGDFCALFEGIFIDKTAQIFWHFMPDHDAACHAACCSLFCLSIYPALGGTKLEECRFGTSSTVEYGCTVRSTQKSAQILAYSIGMCNASIRHGQCANRRDWEVYEGCWSPVQNRRCSRRKNHSSAFRDSYPLLSGRLSADNQDRATQRCHRMLQEMAQTTSRKPCSS